MQFLHAPITFAKKFKIKETKLLTHVILAWSNKKKIKKNGANTSLSVGN